MTLNATVLGELGALENPAGLQKLERLDLSRTPVNAAGPRALRGLGRLRELRLALAKNIDDAAVPVLIEMKTLRVVVLEGTRITADGVARLRAARPDLQLTGLS